MDLSELFADYGACMLTPVVTEGPLCEHYPTRLCLEVTDGVLTAAACRRAGRGGPEGHH